MASSVDTASRRRTVRGNLLDMVDEATAQRWLDAYSRAWETYDPVAIGDLFSDDAEYRF
jgi:hypothetical protein